jgi:hypothetical protein
MLGLATNISLGLWLRSRVEAIAWDAARHVATADPTVPVEHSQAVALERAEDLLGSRSSEVRLEFVSSADSERVELWVEAPGVSLLPRMFPSGFTVGRLDHSIVMRRETS